MFRMGEQMIKLPKDGEIWEKKPCPRGICSMGWSLGVCTVEIDKSKRLSWGTKEQIECGCLIHRKDLE